MLEKKGEIYLVIKGVGVKAKGKRKTVEEIMRVVRVEVEI